MMTLQEIQASNINPVVAKVAYEHASARLADVLETKKTFEQKAFVLFNAYITLALAVCGAGGILLTSLNGTLPAWPFMASGLTFILGAMSFGVTLIDRDYGNLASDPDMWLNKGTLDGEDSVVPLMLAYITYYHKERIKKSNEANNVKSVLIRMGIGLGLAAPIVLAMGIR